MRKWKFLGILAMAMTFAITAFTPDGNAALAVAHHYRAQVHRITDRFQYFMQGYSSGALNLTTATGPTSATTNITYYVTEQGTPGTAATLYTTAGWTYGTSKTNPVTTTVYGTDGGYIDFWCQPATDTTYYLYVDLYVVDAASGFTTLVKNFSPYVHDVFIDETPNIVHHSSYWFNYTNATLTNTGIYFAPYMLIEDCFLEVLTANSGKTINVGTYNLPSAFLSAALLTTTGLVKDTAIPTNATGVNGLYYPATYYGNFLSNSIVGTTAATGGNNIGGMVRQKYLVGASGGNNALQYTTTTGDGSSAGFIHIMLKLLH